VPDSGTAECFDTGTQQQEVMWKLHRRPSRASGEFSMTPARHRARLEWLAEHSSGLGTAGLLEFAHVVHRSRVIMDLKDNWDGEQAKGYDEKTWARAARFAMNHASLSLTLFGTSLPQPKIGPADAGSIDLFWASEVGRLLINIPADADEPITFYGQEAKGGSISGVIPGEDLRADLAAWLVKTK